MNLGQSGRADKQEIKEFSFPHGTNRLGGKIFREFNFWEIEYPEHWLLSALWIRETRKEVP